MSLNPEDWVTDIKLTPSEVCVKFGIDLDDSTNAFWWSIVTSKQIIVTDEFLDMCGYGGSNLCKRASFKSLVRKNNIEYYKILQPVNTKQQLIAINTSDFEFLLMQMRNSRNIKKLYFFLRDIYMMYIKYEYYFELYTNKKLSEANAEYNKLLVQANTNIQFILTQFSNLCLKHNNIINYINNDDINDKTVEDIRTYLNTIDTIKNEELIILNE